MSNTAQSRVLLLGTETADGTIAGVTATGASRPIDRKNDGVLSFYIRGIGTVSTGTLLIEEADFTPSENDYAGTWSQITSIALSTVTGGAQVAYHLTDTSYGMVRVRVSVAVTGGGSVTVVCRSRGAA